LGEEDRHQKHDAACGFGQHEAAEELSIISTL
jgi:hypothetical protein